MTILKIPQLKKLNRSCTKSDRYSPDKEINLVFRSPKTVIEIVDLISSTFKRDKRGREVKVLAVLEYMFHGSCRETSKVLGAAFEPTAKSTVHDLAKKCLKLS